MRLRLTRETPARDRVLDARECMSLSGVHSVSSHVFVSVSMSSSHPDALDASWQNAWHNAQHDISRIRADIASAPPPDPRITRVGKVDAELLDAELIQLLKEPLTKALSLVDVCVC